MQLYQLILLIVPLLTFSQCSAESCMTLNNVTRDDIEAITPDTPVNQVSNHIKCYSKCLIKDYINDEGKIDLQLVGKRAKARELSILAECKKKYDQNFVDNNNNNNNDDDDDDVNCDYAYLILQCLYLGSTNGTVN